MALTPNNCSWIHLYKISMLSQSHGSCRILLSSGWGHLRSKAVLPLGRWFSTVSHRFVVQGSLLIHATWRWRKRFSQWQSSFHLKAALPLFKRLVMAWDRRKWANRMHSMLLLITCSVLKIFISSYFILKYGSHYNPPGTINNIYLSHGDHSWDCTLRLFSSWKCSLFDNRVPVIYDWVPYFQITYRDLILRTCTGTVSPIMATMVTCNIM